MSNKANFLRLLDKILYELHRMPTVMPTRLELYNAVFDNKKEKFRDVDSFFNALKYLNDEGYIFFDLGKDVVVINEKEVAKLYTESFYFSNKYQRINKTLDIIGKIVTPIIALIALGISLYNLFKKKAAQSSGFFTSFPYCLLLSKLR